MYSSFNFKHCTRALNWARLACCSKRWWFIRGATTNFSKFLNNIRIMISIDSDIYEHVQEKNLSPKKWFLKWTKMNHWNLYRAKSCLDSNRVSNRNSKFKFSNSYTIMKSKRINLTCHLLRSFISWVAVWQINFYQLSMNRLVRGFLHLTQCFYHSNDIDLSTYITLHYFLIFTASINVAFHDRLNYFEQIKIFINYFK